MALKFVDRHVGPTEEEIQFMLNTINCSTLQEMVDKAVPKKIQLTEELMLPRAISEHEFLDETEKLGKLNKVYKSYIGMGYYNTLTPSVIKRNILENPGWYTAYTPYQAEIAQGRLEGLLNFQTMVSDLTGMEIANASLLDESTAAAEGMTLAFHSRTRQEEKDGLNDFVVSDNVFPQTKAVLRTRAEPLGINLIFQDPADFKFTDKTFGILIQYPDKYGSVNDYSQMIASAKSRNIKVIAASDLMALTLLTPPGEWGADVVVGSTQRFGVPMGYGGPHAAFFATKEEYKRFIPGRIIGVSVDKFGKPALRMALQTREQHIKRDKATSNICTAQALLANMAAMYAVYHGPKGLKSIAIEIHNKALALAENLKEMGYDVQENEFFDTISISMSEDEKEVLRRAVEKQEINLNYFYENRLVIAVDESASLTDLNSLIDVMAVHKNTKAEYISEIPEVAVFSKDITRTSSYLTHEIFNSYKSETDLMRYIKSLENKDFSLVHSMISLGSCTMKLNAATELYPISNPQFANMHPFAPLNQAEGFTNVIEELEAWLKVITGFSAVSFQPNSGAQGEFAGLMVIREYHKSRGEGHRNIALIPSSAHGTNPASAVLSGMEVVVVKCDELGNIDIDDLQAKAILYKENLAALMVTYPSTHGVFEEGIKEITAIIHQYGGQVYMDGANMNAQVGITNPGLIGADVCHLNLHKTFAIPHGGGGPGVGPIGVAEHLVPFLPSNPVVEIGDEQSLDAISAAPWGSALILLISYGYVKMLGKRGLRTATEIAILNANYIKAKLEGHFPVLYTNINGYCAHEMIIDCRAFKSVGIEVEDIAKRLMDYGYHAPTVSFPVAGTMMIEPTESESQKELDRFISALISIRNEIQEIELGKAEKGNNVLVNAPHTAEVVISDAWDYPYSREKASFPLPYVRLNKIWPSINRINNAHGDRNLVCSCPPTENYESAEVN